MLDDVLAALDTHIAAWVVSHVLGPLRGKKTVIMISHSAAALQVADVEVTMAGGRIAAITPLVEGAPAGGVADVEVTMAGGRIAAITPLAKGAPAGGVADVEVTMAGGRIAAITPLAKGAPAGGVAWQQQEEEEVEEAQQAQQQWQQQSQQEEGLRDGGSTDKEPTLWGGPIQRDALDAGAVITAQQDAEAEGRSVGHVRFGVYLAYARATSWTWVVIIMLSLALMQVSGRGPRATGAWLRGEPTPWWWPIIH